MSAPNLTGNFGNIKDFLVLDIIFLTEKNLSLIFHFRRIKPLW